MYYFQLNYSYFNPIFNFQIHFSNDVIHFEIKLCCLIPLFILISLDNSFSLLVSILFPSFMIWIKFSGKFFLSNIFIIFLRNLLVKCYCLQYDITDTYTHTQICTYVYTGLYIMCVCIFFLSLSFSFSGNLPTLKR